MKNVISIFLMVSLTVLSSSASVDELFKFVVNVEEGMPPKVLNQKNKWLKGSDQNGVGRVSLDLCKHDQQNFRCVEYVKNYDGDTITFNIPGVHPLIGNKVKVRILNVDTAEMRTKDQCEKQKAQQAQKIVENLLKQAKKINLENIRRDKYFRILADVKADGVSIGDYLVQHYLAYRYKGGKKPQTNWCSQELQMERKISTQDE